MKISVLALCIIGASAQFAAAQERDTSASLTQPGMQGMTGGESLRIRGSLSILSTPDSAQVTIDSARAGVTPLLIDSLKPGRHVLRLSGGNPDNWLEYPVIDTVVVSGGELKTLKYVIETRYALSSMPSGAAVFIGESPAGITPTILKIPPTGGEAISIRLKGFETAGVDLAGASRGALMVRLHRIWSPDSAGGVSGVSMMPVRGSPLRLYASALGAIIAGAAAAYFKIQADNQNDLYLLTGDPAAWSKVRKYDTISALSLTAAQIGIGLLAFFLLSE